MKLGFLTACLPEPSLDEIAAWAPEHRLRGAGGGRLAADGQPRRSPLATSMSAGFEQVGPTGCARCFDGTV